MTKEDNDNVSAVTKKNMKVVLPTYDIKTCETVSNALPVARSGAVR